MFGFFGMFGRSQEMQRFDRALRAAGLHPVLAPEAVKLTALKLIKETGREPDSDAAAAALLSYCMLGADGFGETNDASVTEGVEARLEAALEAGDSLDARLVLLALHAGVIQPSVVEQYGLEAV